MPVSHVIFKVRNTSTENLYSVNSDIRKSFSWVTKPQLLLPQPSTWYKLPRYILTSQLGGLLPFLPFEGCSRTSLHLGKKWSKFQLKFIHVSLYTFVLLPTLFFSFNSSSPFLVFISLLYLQIAIISPLRPLARLNKPGFPHLLC